MGSDSQTDFLFLNTTSSSLLLYKANSATDSTQSSNTDVNVEKLKQMFENKEVKNQVMKERAQLKQNLCKINTPL